MRVQRHGLNRTGRDWVLGDIHAGYASVAGAVQAIGFDWANDRLFSVGDLVDRGPEPHRTLAFLRNPRVAALRGNHEDMFLELYSDGTPPEAAVEYVTSHNGMGWFRDLPQDERLAFIDAFSKLPIVMEIETSRGMVGLVHGEVPLGMDWAEFVAAIEAGDKRATKSALWGRTRIEHRVDTGVRGIDRVFCGHSIVDTPTRLGNVYFIDSGNFVGVNSGDPDAGRLTVAELISRTMTFQALPPSGEFFDIRADAVPETAPFGRYAA